MDVDLSINAVFIYVYIYSKYTGLTQFQLLLAIIYPV